MSRSKRKPIIKDKSKTFQKLGSRKLRKKSKEMIAKGQDDKLPHRKREMVNDYDVSDYWWISKDKKAARK